MRAATVTKLSSPWGPLLRPGSAGPFVFCSWGTPEYPITTPGPDPEGKWAKYLFSFNSLPSCLNECNCFRICLILSHFCTLQDHSQNLGYPKNSLLQHTACYGLNCVLLNSYVETLTRRVTVFGGKACKEGVKVKLSHMVGSSLCRTGVHNRKDTRDSSPHNTYVHLPAYIVGWEEGNTLRKLQETNHVIFHSFP